MLKVLIACLFLTAVFAQNCNVDPCSLPAPEGCEYDYCAVTLGTCTPTYYDDDDNVVCEKDIVVCPAYACAMYCSSGYTTDDNGCPTCDCAEDVDCTNVECANIACPDNERAIVLPGNCCPTCVPGCDAVDCPILDCADNETESYGGAYDCCPTCVPEDHCDKAVCPKYPCKEGQVEIDDGCCTVCVNVIDCSMVDCAVPMCPEGMALTMSDDSCCPVCDYIECNDDMECPQVKCAEGYTTMIPVGECCPTCVPENYCDMIACPVFTGDCPEDDDYRVRKNGSCCSYCAGSICEDDDTTRCNSDDMPVCAPGYFRGENCTEEVPESDRFEISIEITISGLTLTEEDIKFFISNVLNIDAMYITVNQTADDSFVITISWDKTDPPQDVNEDALQSQLDDVIAANPNFTKATNNVPQNVDKSDAVKVAVSAVLAVVALAF